MTDARTFFDRIARRYDRSYALSGEPSRARLAALLEILGPPKRILDLGVGTGRELTALQDAGHTVVGLEIAPEMIALCNKRTRPIAITLGDLWAEWPFADHEMDAVIALHGTLSHPPDDLAIDRFFVSAARVLRRGGLVVGELPTAAWLARAHGAGRLEPIAGAGAAARFTDDANGATIEIRLHTPERWKSAARGFALELTAIDDDEVRFVAREVG